jgi:hypothetical protein
MDPMRRGSGIVAVALALAVGGTACRSTAEPTPVPINVAPATIVENYSGTLFASGSNLHTFAVKENGEMKVTLRSIATVAVDPDPNASPPLPAIPSAPVTASMRLTVGQPTLTTLGVQCSTLKSVEAPAGPSPQLTGQALAGTFCVSIADSNSDLPRAASYAITVIHS